jgi:DNA helicase IV
MASETKGLEFYAVLVVAPERIFAGSARGAADLDVPLTRATQRPGVQHHGPLPRAPSGLTETG